MKIKYKPGDEMDIQIKGIVKRISVEGDEVCYTVAAKDGLGRENYLYFSEHIDDERDI